MAKVNPKAAAAAIAAAVAVAAPIAMRHEGYRGKAYLDPVKVLTQCYGETRDVDPSRIYSKDECAVKLRARMAEDYAPALLDCMPDLIAAAHDPKAAKVFGAFLDTSYNVGPVRVCRRFASFVNTGRTKQACKDLEGWFTTAKDRKTGIRRTYPGLVTRRKEEKALCLSGL